MTWEINYEVRPADPYDRRDHPDAHEVRMDGGSNPIRIAGVYTSKRVADEVAAFLNQWAGSQVR